jgi:hypothetical protein
VATPLLTIPLTAFAVVPRAVVKEKTRDVSELTIDCNLEVATVIFTVTITELEVFMSDANSRARI